MGSSRTPLSDDRSITKRSGARLPAKNRSSKGCNRNGSDPKMPFPFPSSRAAATRSRSFFQLARTRNRCDFLGSWDGTKECGLLLERIEIRPDEIRCRHCLLPASARRSSASDPPPDRLVSHLKGVLPNDSHHDEDRRPGNPDRPWHARARSVRVPTVAGTVA